MASVFWWFWILTDLFKLFQIPQLQTTIILSHYMETRSRAEVSYYLVQLYQELWF